jgi:hypothetical protein
MLRKMVVLSLVVGLGAFGAGCGDPCEAAAEDFVAAYEACGIDTGTDGGDGAEVECTDTLQAQLECSAACAAAAPCEALDGTDADAALDYGLCVADCI